MIKMLRRYFASCELDRPGHRASGEFAEVHRRLCESAAPRLEPSPALRSRIMGALRESEAPARPGVAWRWALAGVACLLLAGAMIPVVTRNAVPAAATDRIGAIQIPVGASPMLRLVSGSVDKPLLDQAQKMYDDTRRATRMVAACVPFARRGG